MIWNGKKRLCAKFKSFALHCWRYHFKRLARTNAVCKQRIFAKKCVSYRILLMFFQRDLRIHAWKTKCRTVIFTGTNGIKLSVVLSNCDLIPSLNRFSHHSCKLSIASLMTPILSPSFPYAGYPHTTRHAAVKKFGRFIRHLSSCLREPERGRLQGESVQNQP